MKDQDHASMENPVAGAQSGPHVRRGPTLTELLAVEDDPPFAQLACRETGVLAWPSIRATGLRLIIGDLYFQGETPVRLAARPSYLRAGSAAVRSLIRDSRTRAPRVSVLLLANGAGLRLTDAGLFNPYVDYFAQVLGRDAWTVESVHEDHWPSNPRANSRLSFAGYDRFVIAARGQLLASRHFATARELVALFEERAQSLLGWTLGSDRRRRVVRIAARRLASYAPRAERARRLFERFTPTVALAPEGCDGQMAVFNSVAREMGIHVGEYQHGLVSRGHDTYNVAPELLRSHSYRQTQPQSFLGYGQWWLDQFNAPVESRIVIGSPNRDHQVEQYPPAPTQASIVVMGDGIDTARHLEFAVDLAAQLPDRRVVFRPHPWERTSVRVPRGIDIDTASSIYESFQPAEAVVGEASTALFEAIGIVPRIFAWRTAKSQFYLPDSPFPAVHTASDVAEMLGAEASPSTTELPTEIWASNWRRNFSTWLGTFGIGA